MNNAHKVTKIADKLIQWSKENKLDWNYLEDDNALLKMVDSRLCDYIVERSDSFYCNIGKGFFVLASVKYRYLDELNLFTDNNRRTVAMEPPALFLISIPALNSRDHGCLNKYDEHQGVLLRLQNIAKRQYPNTEDFINEFMAM